MIFRLRHASDQYVRNYEAYKSTPWEFDRQPNWFKEILEVWVEKLHSHYPKFEFIVSNPHGLGCISWIDVLQSGKRVGTAAFVPGDLSIGEICWKDFSESSGEYPSGSIGDLNGMNYPEREIPRQAGLPWLFKHLMRKDSK